MGRDKAASASGPAGKFPLLAPPASEDEILALIDALFPSRTAHVPFGRGDDCAELEGAPRPLAVSTDMFWQDVHFKCRYFTPEETGAKALSSAVSDLAAAGAAPLGFSLALMLPRGTAAATLRGLLRGMARKAKEYGMALSGGDLTQGDRLGFSVTVWGEPAEAGCPFLRRAQAQAGHCLFLVGDAGLAGVGLWALEREGRAALDSWPAACAAHLEARPLLAQGRAIARLARDEADKARAKGRAAPRFSLMDLSDGLLRDLPRLLGDLGADLDFDTSLIPAEVAAAAPLMGMTPEEAFLLGGEDYALLGSCPGNLWPRLLKAVPTARLIGKARQTAGLSLRGERLTLKGFDHFDAAGARTPQSASLPPEAQDAAQSLMAAGREAWEAGLMAGFNGNISCRVSLADHSEGCLITRSGAAKARLAPEDFALLALPGGKPVAGAAPSTESAVHTGIYKACPQSRAVLHVHPPFLLALCLALPEKERLALPLPEAEAYRARLAWTPFFPPGSRELARAVARAARKHAAVWMERHGLVVHGPDPAYVLSLAEELEQLARVQLALQQF